MEKQRVIVDIDGTLFEPDYYYEVEYFKSILSKDDAEKFIPMIPRLLNEYENRYSRYDVKKLSRYLIASSGVLITENMVRGWRDAFGSAEPKLIDGAVDALEDLKMRDKELVILTNWFLKPQTIRLEKAGIKEYFTEFYGGEYAIKPHRDSYKMACGKHPIEECVIVGDSLDKDVLAPMMYGMDAIYYNSNNNDNYDKNKVKSIGSMYNLGRMI